MTFPYGNCDLNTKKQIDDLDAKLAELEALLKDLQEQMQEAVGPEKAYIGRREHGVFEKMDRLSKERNSLLNTCGIEGPNWSGYSVDAVPQALSISAEWNVPSVTPSLTGNNTLSAAWIGFSGPPSIDTSSIIQIGTSQMILNNTPSYFAWFQLYFLVDNTKPFNLCKDGPGTCDPFNNPGDIRDALPVKPGDHIRANIRRMISNPNRWRLYIRNSTQGWGFATIQTYTDKMGNPGLQSNAAFILEDPDGDLANYNKVTFENCRVNGTNPHLHNSQSIVMTFDSKHSTVPGGQNGDIISIPSEPSSSGDAFSVSFGSNKPPSP
nr:G1 family glutamic endopeptidase [Bacillus cereus]